MLHSAKKFLELLEVKTDLNSEYLKLFYNIIYFQPPIFMLIQYTICTYVKPCLLITENPHFHFLKSILG